MVRTQTIAWYMVVLASYMYSYSTHSNVLNVRHKIYFLECSLSPGDDHIHVHVHTYHVHEHVHVYMYVRAYIHTCTYMYMYYYRQLMVGQLYRPLGLTQGHGVPDVCLDVVCFLLQRL